MKLLNRVTLVLVLLAVMSVATACGGNNSPTDVAKIFFEGILKTDASAIRSVICEARRGGVTDELVAEKREAMAAIDTSDLTSVTYTYNKTTSSVSVGGDVRINVNGLSIRVSANALIPEGIPVVKEGLNWRVCPLYPMGG